jgi:predicted TIM-barrel fold metal-dependent hydrolase
MSFTPGVGDMKVRLDHLKAEGVEKEIAYPQSLLFFIGHKDREVQELIWRTYNEYMARMSRESGGRFYGVGVFSNWWDPSKAEAAMQQIVDLGLKTFMIPIYPKDADDKELSYGDVPMDRFWSVAAEAGLPVGFHVTENFTPGARGGMGSTITMSYNHFRKPLTQIIFGGVFDRHPNLKVVFAEGGLSWVLPALQDAEMVYDTYGNGDLLDPIKERPTTYWQNNCYATFQNDLLGLKNLDYLGAGNVMWSNDYPHSEGSYGMGRDSTQAVLDATTSDNARKILGGTAMELYKLG